MIDKEFELQMEAQAALLTNEGYFERYRYHLSISTTCKAAWEATESELPFGLRRFTHYQSFQKALRMETKKKLPSKLLFSRT